ncbi:MAG: hypothetical protein ACJ76F_13530 [Bacteroidia bacterium]
MKVKDTILLLAFLALVASACDNKNNGRANENRDNYNHSNDSTGTVPAYPAKDSNQVK